MSTPAVPMRPDRPVFTGDRDATPMTLGSATRDPLAARGLHRHRTQSGQTYTHGHLGFGTPHLHERDLDVHDPR